MSQSITQKQVEILDLLYRFRFLNRIQIQAFLHHKDYRRINAWLKDLTDREYINRIYSASTRDNTKPAIYYLGLNGIRFLKAEVTDDGEWAYPHEILRARYRESERTNSFIDQCVFIADMVLNLKKVSIESQESSENEYVITHGITTATDIADPNSDFYFLSDLQLDKKIGIDLVVEQRKKKKIKGRTKTTQYLFKVFEPTMPKYSIRRRLKDFIDFYWSNDWEDEQDTSFPTIMLICPTVGMLIYGKRVLRELREDGDDLKDLRIFFSTIGAIRERGVTGDGVWERAR